MPIAKYVLLLDSDEAGGPAEREDAAQAVLSRAGTAPAALVGLTVETVIEPLTGPLETLAVVQAWIDTDDTNAGAELLGDLTDSVTADVSVWVADELVFLAPVPRRSRTESPSGISLFGTAAKREDFTTEAFFDYWTTTHAPISASVPGSRGYVVSRVVDTVNSHRERTVDAFLELWWPSREAFEAAGDSPAQAEAWEDVPNYARTDGQFWLTHEHVAIVPPDSGPGLFDG